jgi:hypothetical protein
VRRVIILMATAGVLLALAVGVAFAATFTCQDRLCVGTNQSDLIRERRGDNKQDNILAKAGDDVVRAQRFENDRDLVSGGGGDDRINVADGDGRDEVVCNGGFDRVRADPGDEFGSQCEIVNRQPVTVTPTL